MLLLIYISVLAALALAAPDSVWDNDSRNFIILIGAVGIWRYGWNLIHVVRSLIYRWVVFPSRRMSANALAKHKAPHVFMVVTCYRIPASTVALSVRALIQEAMNYDTKTTIVASVVEAADQRMIKRIFQIIDPPPHIQLMLVRMPGHGKRQALAGALRGIARSKPEPGSAVMLLDGDNVIPLGTLSKCLPFFDSLPHIWAMTTDEDCVVQKGSIFHREWHRLRFAQRHLVFSSLALSDRVLCLTGRMSIYRAEIATDTSFIEAIEHDSVDHWRLGKIAMLTGDDKSTWFWVLKNGGSMLYVPDVRTRSIEHPPSKDFIVSSTQLMLRWSGNMIRTNGRALSLGPRRVGAFLWWTLVDQRLSMWTPLIAPIILLGYAFFVSPIYVYTYAIWTGLTRLYLAIMLMTARPEINGLTPLMIYYNQIIGSLIKLYAMFRMDEQRWTRQNIAGSKWTRRRRFAWLRKHESAVIHSVAIASFVVLIAFYTGGLSLPHIDTIF